MLDSNTTRSKNLKGRIRSSGFLNSIGMERTTAAFLAGVAFLLFLFISILGTETAPNSNVDRLDEERPLTTKRASEPVEVLVAPRNKSAGSPE